MLHHSKLPFIFGLLISIVFFCFIIMLLAPFQVKAEIKDKDNAYQKTGEARNSSHTTMSVGFPAAVVIDTERFKEGNLEVARDIITGNRLVAVIKGGEEKGFRIINTSGQILDLTSVDIEGPSNCGTVLCLHNQIKRCYNLPGGECFCSCGVFFHDTRLPD